MDKASLSNWDLQLEDLSQFLPSNYKTLSDNFLVTRSDFNGGKIVLSEVGARYKEVSNEDLFQFADNILDGGKVKWESAGVRKSGKQVWGCMSLDRDIVLDPSGANDITKMYLIVTTSHDGSTPVLAAVSPVRVWCQNMLNFALKSSKQTFKIRHTQTVDGKIAVAREALGLTFKYADEFEKEAELLYNTKVTNQTFNKIVETLYPMPDSEAKIALTKWENKIDVVKDLYLNTPHNANIKGTAWGVVNALGERLDYHRIVRKGNTENSMAGASGFDPLVTAEKNKIVQVVKQLVRV
jgi:phage/plasmid-like protein (TIGR03299 family)